ncbi:HNH endonuclease signature motif containing protein (plasmid) [Bacillus carboniphilus]|uniref:Putative HNH nuclease YajD n=1 Tax=Bacillus carboniphilus TaxID=86663 RepID=A0ABY9JYP3_9BACI|nr:HNH endonuclease signature motif containing protein [Bacillus carboniphilus]WLR44470.1 HNH endonuclease signature motif containing protein [Bacillus carboniphilus]
MDTATIRKYFESGDLMKFYKSREWMKLRLVALRRDNYECQMCKDEGRYHKAENVHHVKEVKDRPDLALDIDNLLCLCIKCHNLVHKRERIKREPKFWIEEKW